MFKKRLVKKQGGKVTRKLELLDSDSSDSEVKRSSNDSIKFKRQKFKHASDVKTKSEKEEETPKPVNKELSNESSDRAATSIITAENVGPVKPLPQNIKTITITDFQPDVCKDFMQTGYCGYGDTCKFLHIRDESRQKKQINRDWETVSKKDYNNNNNSNNNNKEAVPFKCLLCKKDYSSPIRTECNHLFCQECFLNRFKVKKKTTCYICGKETNGIFTPVPKKELETLLAI